MKILLTIGCILVCFCSLTPRYFISNAEYAEVLIDRSDSSAHFVSGVISTISGTPAKVIGAAAAAHGSYVWDQNHDLYYQGDNTSGAAGLGDTSTHSGYNKIPTDSLGNTFGNIWQVCAGGTAYGNSWNVIALKLDSTIWVWGNTQGGFRGDGSDGYRANTRPVQVFLPGGVKAVKIQGGDYACVIGSDGNEYKWGGNAGFFARYELAQGTNSPTYKVPTKCVFGSETAKVVDIAEGPQADLTLLDNRHMYGAAYWGSLLMVGSGAWGTPVASLFETRVDTAYASIITDSIVSIKANSTGFGFRTVTCKLWYAGDNICGTAGNGTGINWAAYTGTNGFAPWNWDQQLGEFFIRKPVQVAPGHYFTDFFMSNALGYSMMATDSADRIIAWGRGKSGVLADSMTQLDGSAPGISAIYPNSVDRIYATYVNPFGTGTVSVYSRFCVLNHSGSPCNSITYFSHSPLSINFTMRYVPGVGIIFTMIASGSNPGFSATVWQSGGPVTLDMGVQSQQGNVIIDTVKTAGGGPIANGTYTGIAQSINNYGDTALAYASVQTGSYIPIPAGSKVVVH